MLHLLTLIGARPQIIKAAALSRVIHSQFKDRIRETIVHTGQHYDAEMSQVFFDELGIPAPDYNLGIGSSGQNRQLADMLLAISETIAKVRPDAVVVFGDTNSTLAGALAASQNRLPVVHIEAGLRSFNREMPEEMNRVLSDHVSTLLFSPTGAGFANLAREGIAAERNPVRASASQPAVFHCGDIMYDNSLWFAGIAAEKSRIIEIEKLEAEKFFLVTVHRNFNADDPARLSGIVEALIRLHKETGLPVIFPVHPRTRATIGRDAALRKKLDECKGLRLLPPVSFLDMIRLEKNAKLILTDSGGVQKEAFFFRKPCVVLREETEWTELTECGAARLAGADPDKIQEAARILLQAKINYPGIFGDGKAAAFICSEMLRHLA